MSEHDDFVRVGSAKVSMQTSVRLADIQQLKGLAGRLGGMPHLKVLVDMLTELEDFARLGQSPTSHK